MSISTVIVIVVSCLLIYYAGMISYDTYIAKMTDANKEEDQEKAIDISGMAEGFTSEPVNPQKNRNDSKSRFETRIQSGIEVTDFSRILNSGDDEIHNQLGNLTMMVTKAA